MRGDVMRLERRASVCRHYPVGMTPDTVGLLTALADAERIAVLGWFAARSEGSSLTDAANGTGLPIKRLQKVVAPLLGAGLVVRSEDGFRFDPEPLRRASTAALGELPMGRALAEHPRLNSVVHNGMATRLPVQSELKTELARVLASLLPAFDRATEPELNGWLAALTTDVPLMRRLLVDEGLLDRSPDGAEYRRPG